MMLIILIVKIVCARIVKLNNLKCIFLSILHFQKGFYEVKSGNTYSCLPCIYPCENCSDATTCISCKVSNDTDGVTSMR